eukprot:TRINITY_DN419_c2_g1_i1.p1 TRINITY_DN419_c2_g1~~TRINITY_DN419_c2_g1_i1.p1  ORF type:complete len:400 (+),score=107.99 TRINITY_DN419_c2_g1_i1:66-1265(+)
MNVMRAFGRSAIRGQVRFLNTPHGGSLINTMVTDEAQKADLIARCNGVTFELNERQSCDTQLIATGAFSPLEGFMGEEDYQSVVDDMKLTNGNIFGLPVCLDTDRTDIKEGQHVLLTYNQQPMAVLDVTSKFKPNKVVECKKLYGTSELEHPGCLMVATERGQYYMGGTIHGLSLPKRDFPCATPAEVRSFLPADKDVVAFQCRNPVHRAHYELFTRALDAPNVGSDGVVLVHPTCGPTQADDIPGTVRYHTYEVLKEETKNERVHWAYMPYSMHMAGPREAIQHMLLRKNYGCTHFIIGRDMAGSKSSITGEDYYGAYDAQETAAKYGPELGMKTVPSLNLVYTEEGYMTADDAKAKELKPLKLSGTEFRRRLRAGEDIPEWFAFKSVVQVLRDAQKA